MAFWLMNNAFDYQRPSRINDQHFGLVLEPEDMVAPLLARDLNSMQRYPGGYLMRPWRSLGSTRDAGSTVSMAQDQFKVNLDVQQFKPEEISVKVIGDDVVIIEGKHEEKQDEHGYISRQFVRRYALPKGHDASKVESKLSSDGVLTVTAPRMAVVGEEASRKVPITQTGEVFNAAMEKKTGEEKKYEQRTLDQKIKEKMVEKVGEKEADKKVEKEVEMKVQKLEEMEKVDKEAEEEEQLVGPPKLAEMENVEKEAEEATELIGELERAEMEDVREQLEEVKEKITESDCTSSEEGEVSEMEEGKEEGAVIKIQKLEKIEKVEKEAEMKADKKVKSTAPLSAELEHIEDEAVMKAEKKTLLEAITTAITPNKVEKGVEKTVGEPEGEPKGITVVEGATTPEYASGEEVDVKEEKEEEAVIVVQKLEKIEKVEKESEMKAEMEEGKEKTADIKVQKPEKMEKGEKKAEMKEKKWSQKPRSQGVRMVQMNEQKTEEKIVASKSTNKDAKSDDKKKAK